MPRQKNSLFSEQRRWRLVDLTLEIASTHLEVGLSDEYWNGQTLVVLIHWTVLTIFMQNAQKNIA